MLDPPLLAPDVVVLDVNLRGLGERGQLLVGRLGGDDAGVVRPQSLQPHGEAALVQRVKLEEAGPGFVEQDVVAQRPELFQNGAGVVDRAVVGALLDHRDPEWPLALPGLGIGDQRIGADFLPDARLIQRLVIDRADHAVGVAVGFQEDRDAAAE